MAVREEPCVSIFMPSHRAGAATKQDPIRLKNLLRQAEERLLDAGLRRPQAKALLKPASALLDDSLFWRYQSDGLAVFVAPGGARRYRLPYRFDELVVVAGRFHLKPLLPLFTGEGRFYVLALSQNEVRLLQGTRHSVDEVELNTVPPSLAEALKYDDPEKQLQFHTRTPGGAGPRPAIFHGHGTGDVKDDLLRYFQQIDRGLRELLRDEQAPLVLAGVEYLLPIYRQASGYPHVVEEGITGNPEGTRAKELHAQAWAIVEPRFLEAREAAAARYRQLAGSGAASADLREILPAAAHGRVDFLFVAVGVQRWGTFDPDTGAVELHEEAAAGDEDLLDRAALETLTSAGVVYAAEPPLVPADAPLAAVFRY
ncbi:MAG: hypothetical protein HYY64_09110 [Candidatus Rokubacteria bacterium]|nr:hypothetical protein [Candidatus Rokubacteria bacterium]